MLFQSQGFVLLFLPSLVSLYYLLPSNPPPLRQFALILGSLFFYGWWDARFVPLLITQVSLSWGLSYVHERSGRNAPLYIGIALNLASLATFKYLDFALASAETLVGISLPRAHIVLPIGISFFSFQLISYLVDRLRRDAPLYPFRLFALFVMIFPHLIAGPIVRHNELIPQFALDPLRPGIWRRFATGLILFTLGFAKKVLLADKLAELVDPMFIEAGKRSLSFAEAWTAALGFSFQLFLDFSAYTEMAIGIALLFGLVLPENFRRPYLATNLRDFWRRWHISLSTFLRDYLYIPLGGSRAGFARYTVATMATMALCGLWHGAGWSFVAWGIWHGMGLIVCHGWQTLKRPLPGVCAWIVTMTFVLVGWVLFRAVDFATAASILGSMSGTYGIGGVWRNSGLLVAGALVSTLVPSAHEIKDQLIAPPPTVAWAAAATLAVLAGFCVLEVGGGPPLNFIYFQF
jgi:alginate O-acetyltransferase complex protein AlgI